MARPLPTALRCYSSGRVDGTLVFDPAEASPAQAPAGVFVRLYDTGSSPLAPWVELPWEPLAEVTSQTAIEAALALYACREEREAQARQRRRERVQKALRREKAARAAAEAERLVRLREERARKWAEARAAKEADAAQALREARMRAHAAEAAARGRSDQAAVLHRDSDSPDAALQVYEIETVSLLERRFTVLYDAQGQPEGGPVFVYRHEPVQGVHALAGIRRLDTDPSARPSVSRSGCRKIITSYRTWQAKQREEVRRDALRAEYREALSRARHALAAPCAESVSLAGIRLMRRDVQLALTWCRGTDATLSHRLQQRLDRCGWSLDRFLPEVRHAREEDGTWPRELTLLKQMLAARLAERAVKQFYERNDPALAPPGRGMTDMSIRQLDGGPGFEEEYDLVYPGDPAPAGTAEEAPKRLDVKNSRMDPGDPNGYSRHYVKKLRVLGDGSPVRIVAAVSETTSLAGLLSGEGRVRVLGELDRRQVDRMEQDYGLSSLRLHLREPEKSGEFYPPWIFEAPSFVTASRFQALDALRQACGAHPEAEAREVVPIPIALAAGIPLHEAQRASLSPGQADLVDLLLRGDRTRRSLPHLYLTLLRQFFAFLAGPPEERAGYDPAGYHELLFTGSSRRYPLGLPDPLESVAGLLDSLSSLLEQGWEHLTRFTAFEFRRAGILYGYRADDPKRWTLMFTHCQQVTRCRGKRLVFGQERICEHCRHLICRKCSFCEDRCAGLRERGVQVWRRGEDPRASDA